jgi:hypothetical protein
VRYNPGGSTPLRLRLREKIEQGGRREQGSSKGSHGRFSMFQEKSLRKLDFNKVKAEVKMLACREMQGDICRKEEEKL